MESSERAVYSPSQAVTFADVAHQTIVFDRQDPITRLVLSLIDTAWVQRLRYIKQTGHTNLVYMFAEHSRFGHSIGVCYLAHLLLTQLLKQNPEMVQPYRAAVTVAALLHDIGHVAPGSHVAAEMWAPEDSDAHEQISARIVQENKEIYVLLESFQPGLSRLVSQILDEDRSLPRWTTAIISGGGWNADRGNWAIVDSAMCSVSYGRYNVYALIDAFRLSRDGDLVLEESRLDALTHFFVARDSMYRQVYQHRVLQAADAISSRIVLRLRDLLVGESASTAPEKLGALNVCCDDTMLQVLLSHNYAQELSLTTIFQMTESWWTYHLERWCQAEDSVLRDLSERLHLRRLFKTIRLNQEERGADEKLRTSVAEALAELGYNPRYYLAEIDNSDKHRRKSEGVPLVLLDSGEIVPADQVEPMIARLLEENGKRRSWLAVPNEVKLRVGRLR